jgi:uncharacterized protein YegP (UPF0339 family)
VSARFEIVHGDHGWFARFRAANGRIVWVTETYKRYINADRAVAILWEDFTAHDVRRVDERTVS